jgi:hypothetical protein
VHHLLRKANDHRFGARSERLDRLAADQLQLALEDIEASLAGPRRSRRRKSPGCHARRRANAGHCPSICLASTRRWCRRAATARAATRRCI